MRKKHGLHRMLLIAIVTFLLGCERGDGGLLDSSSPPTTPPPTASSPTEPPPSAFNFTSIDIDKFSGKGTYAATFSWDKSIGASAYTLCRKDIIQQGECEVLASTSNVVGSANVEGSLKNLDSDFFILATGSNGKSTKSNQLSLTTAQLLELVTYVKASNTGVNDTFGSSVSLSADGKTLAVGANKESSSSTGINGDQTDNSAVNSGAVYLFRYDGSRWAQQAYIKASNTEANDSFGESVAISADGNTLVVGADGESSNATGINGNQSDNSASESGAVYVFRYDGSNWAQQAYIKAANTETEDRFGQIVSISSDGNTIAVGAYGEDSNATGINGNQLDNSASSSGAVYLYRFDGSNWSQQAYIKASNTQISDAFGEKISLSSDGNVLAVGAKDEDSNATGVNGNESDNSAFNSGATYVFRFDGSNWSQQAYIKASNTDIFDVFAFSVALSGDGNTLAVSSFLEDSNARGINGNDADNSSMDSGAVYLYRYDGAAWSQQAYIKASNSDDTDMFGESVALSTDGNTLAVGTMFEGSSAKGIDGDQTDNSTFSSGAVYLFGYDASAWQQSAYIKASNTESSDFFGYRVSLSGDGEVLVVSSSDGSNATGINGDDTDNSAAAAGAVYLY